MKILVIGNGGREHAIAWKVAQSSLVSKVFVAPGNAGTKLEPALENISINITDINSLLEFARNKRIDLTIVGPEIPLMIGIVDIFRSAGLKIFGPTKAAAQIEGSKIFGKHFLTRHNIPTAKYHIFNEVSSALKYIRKKDMPIVVKADGLAAGKGVTVAMFQNEAELTIKDMLLHNKFGKAGNSIIIEEFLDGKEVSFIVMVDGEHVLPMVTSQDYKRLGDGDTGPNTGGMGAYSPVPIVTDEIFQRIMKYIIWPTINGMAMEGNIYTGFLYVGLVIDKIGNPKVIEFNCRSGDPETQTIIFRMKSDLVDLCIAGCEGKLNEKLPLEWDNRSSLSVVMATSGYPNNYPIGDEIYGLPLEIADDRKIFHAGTKISTNGRLLTNGGRVLCITTLGDNIEKAQKLAYSLVTNISWTGSFSRKDIGNNTNFS